MDSGMVLYTLSLVKNRLHFRHTSPCNEIEWLDFREIFYYINCEKG